MADADPARSTFGANSWLVEEMFEQYRDDPHSVGESWREFFEDYRSLTAAAHAPAAEPAPPPPTTASHHRRRSAAAESPAAPEPPAPAAAEPGDLIKGVGAVIVKNMEASLGVPTATSFRNVPAKLLEVNRKVINGYRSRSGQGKVSFTHLIGYAIIRAIAEAVPNMRNGFVEGTDGKPRVVRNDHVSMGLAVDVDKGDGTRTLIVPVLKEADSHDFAGFLAAYEELIRKVKNNKLTIDDYAGANITLTNPGTIGTVQSVPRLMPGQGVIVGVGNIDYPAEFEGADRRNLSSLGISKVVTITSTYDHRIIQGAESGLFLKRVHELLLGDHGFYEEIFQSLDMPYEAVKWRPDLNPIDREEAMLAKQMAVAKLIRVHRVRGHLIADLDPLHWKEPHTPVELDPATYGLTIWDLDREFLTDGVGGQDKMSLGDLLGVLRDAYCRTIGVEYMHIQNTAEQAWIQHQVEVKPAAWTKDQKYRILERLNAAEAFEKFLATKYVGTKRFGIEGAESAIPILDEILSGAADAGLDGAVLGMAHRGRLNVLSNIMGKSYEAIFSEFEGHVDPATVQGSGDVKYHLGATGKYESPSGADIRIELAANPSHLETCDPIVMGMVRAEQDQIDPPGAYSVLPLLIHGDAAFAGQGIVAECLAMSDIAGYRIGGTIHLIINNQIGFTTAPEMSRSSFYCSDVAKTVQAPIFHVNGDDPEACVRVARLAWEYRQTFHKDVVIDMVCYRRHGHNEGDDPSYTQPLMYKAIAERRSVRKLYVESLVKRGDITVDEAEQALSDFQHKLQVALDETRSKAGETPKVPRPPKPLGVLPHVQTGVERSTLDRIFAQLTDVSRRVHAASQAGQAVREPWQAVRGRPRRRLGHRRSDGDRLAPARGPPGSPRRRGLAARHVQPASRRARRLRDRRTLGAAGRARRRTRELLGVRLAALRVRRARLRVRLRALVPGVARHVGSPVRRLRQRRADHHRPVPRRGRGQVGAAQRSRPAAASRVRGAGARAQLGAHRAVPRRSPPRTTCRSSTPPPRRSTSTCCDARCTRSGTRRWWCSRPSRGCG